MSARAERGRRAVAAVELLGQLEHANGICELFTTVGITGDHLADSDPVSNWVFAETGVRISINKTEWTYGGGFRETPQRVAEFIHAFEMGRYPHLDSTRATVDDGSQVGRLAAGTLNSEFVVRAAGGAS